MSNQPDIVTTLRDCTCIPHGEICREAADEIERLRMLLCAAESVADAKHDIPTLIRERDEARRETCYELSGWKQSAYEQEARAEAKRRGWDCFKGETP